MLSIFNAASEELYVGADHCDNIELELACIPSGSTYYVTDPAIWDP